MSGESLAAQVLRLRREITAHKSAIKRHRDALGTTKAALTALEQECQRRGIAIVIVPPSDSHTHGEGDFHGRHEPETSTS